jgi:hypothetical protein
VAQRSAPPARSGSRLPKAVAIGCLHWEPKTASPICIINDPALSRCILWPLLCGPPVVRIGSAHFPRRRCWRRQPFCPPFVPLEGVGLLVELTGDDCRRSRASTRYVTRRGATSRLMSFISSQLNDQVLRHARWQPLDYLPQGDIQQAPRGVADFQSMLWTVCQSTAFVLPQQQRL